MLSQSPHKRLNPTEQNDCPAPQACSPSTALRPVGPQLWARGKGMRALDGNPVSADPDLKLCIHSPGPDHYTMASWLPGHGHLPALERPSGPTGNTHHLTHEHRQQAHT